MENKKLDKTLENTIKDFSFFIKRKFDKIHRYLWFSWWLVILLVFIIVFLVFHYENKINNQNYLNAVYYETPFRVNYRANIFNDFDRYFDRQHKYLNNLFEKQEKLIRNYSNFFDKPIVVSSNNTQQKYQKYYLYDWKIYSYKFDYDNWFVNWSFMVDDNYKKSELIKKINELWLEISDLGSNVVFSWKIENISFLLKNLD